ncbi:hypothetical protein DCAR_0831529 [Daucus carota subsp. sativus]|uniref:N-acetyltransferase domain-containing protein n=1 Tax=Daucus carota subsp. sativus TaxID=79200 RepID=A0AAF0XRM7_DAUCS|nr:hypothetical protein DCAR_0831529 [Daucus carota subsp. sativus]
MKYDFKCKSLGYKLFYVIYYLHIFLRQGHVEALLSAAIEKCRARKVHQISPHVDPSRTAALNLYKKFGFQVNSLVEGYYSSDRNAYQMYLDFEIY